MPHWKKKKSTKAKTKPNLLFPNFLCLSTEMVNVHKAVFRENIVSDYPKCKIRRNYNLFYE